MKFNAVACAKKVIRQTYANAKMTPIVVDELKLIADFLNGAPGVNLELFRRAKITTIQLLTFTEIELSTAIGTVQPEVDTKQLWSWIVTWRNRNGLANVTLASKKTASGAVHVSLPVDVGNFRQAEQADLEQDRAAEEVLEQKQSVCATETFDPNFDRPLDLKLNTPWKYDLNCGILDNQPGCSKTADRKIEKEEDDDISSHPSEDITIQYENTPEQDTTEEAEEFDTDNVGAINIPSVKHEVSSDHAEDEATTLPRLTPDRLKELLQKPKFGKKLVQTAETHSLSDVGTRLVVDTVARYHLALNRKASAEAVDDLSEVIVGLFKKERKDTYYMPKTKSRGNPAGKLYSRINYIRQSERNRDQQQDQHVSSNSSDIEIADNSPEVASALTWLEINKFPWVTVLSQWEASFPARKADLRQYSNANHLINNYPHLTEEFGYQLLDIDYTKLGLGNPADPSRKWNSLFEPVGRYVSKNAKDPSAKDLSRALKDNELTTDRRLLHLLLALNTVLIPVKASKGLKPTVATAQAETFLLVENKSYALTELDKTIKIYEEHHFAIAPKLIVLGSNLATATGECMVVYKGIIYTLPTIVRGVDVLVKLHMVLGLPVDKFSKLVWVFIQQFVNGASSDHGGYLSINKLIQFLSSQP